MIRHNGCTVTITSVGISGRFLYRLRIWDEKGRQVVAIRVWADRPYTPGALVRLQPEGVGIREGEPCLP